MKEKRFNVTIATICMAAVCIGTYKTYHAYHKTTNLNALLSENSIALSQNEYFPDCVRETNKCTIEVGAKGSVQLLGGTILKAGADGKVSFDGEVICSSGGKTYCKPIECTELYSILK